MQFKKPSEQPMGTADALDPTSSTNRLRFRAPVEGLPAYSAGRSVRDAIRQRPLDGPMAALAANESPYGPFPSAIDALRTHTATINRYPESGFTALRQALARHLSLPPDRVAVGAGGIAIIHHLSLALLQPGDEVLQSSPTFHAYELDARKFGARIVSAAVTTDGCYDLEAMRAKIGPRTRLIYVCNPNNPTGGIVDREDLLRFVQSVPTNIAIFVDEAYFEYVEDPNCPDTIRDQVFHRPNLITLRTFSKAYGLAGLRVAYAVGAPAIVEAIGKVQSNYEVTSLSQLAAIASLADPAELERRRAHNRRARAALVAGLRANGYTPLPSQANFVCVRVGAAKEVATALESYGVIVRPLDAMGDPSSIRITVGTDGEVKQVIDALAALSRAIAPRGSHA